MTKNKIILSPVQTKTNQSKKYPIRVIFWLLAISLGAFQAWANRYSISSEDGISYLDIADAYLRGEWNVAINPHWSPFYSWLLGLATLVLKPSTYWEFPVVKLVNFLIYLFTLGCFEFFLREFIFYYNNNVSRFSRNSSFSISKWTWLLLGYTLFIWSSLKWIGVSCDTPDMCTAAFVYLASGIVLRVNTRSASWFNFIILGLVLGFGYLAKSVMFPLAFVFLGVSAFSVGNLRRALPRVLAALLVFTVISIPFIAAISTAKGRLTIGEAGKLSYAWYIGPIVADHHWQGELPGTGTPKHPTRKIIAEPAAFEFGTPVGGTYPVWYDPSYWNEGLKPKFSLIKQIKKVAKNAVYYDKEFLGSLVFGYLILVGVSGSFWLSIQELTASWRLLIPAAAGLGIFLITTDVGLLVLELQASTRYIAPFIVLLFAGVFSSMRLPNSSESRRLIAGITIAVLVITGSQLSLQASKNVVTILRGPEHTHWQVAESLHELGILPGEKVADLKVKAYDYYWARLARVKIVAQIMDAEKFWTQDDVLRSKALKTIERTGARVIVQKDGSKIPDSAIATGWKKLGNTDSYAYLFRK